MTTIILSVLGILLAAAAALMVVFYGGNAFNKSTTESSASMIINAGQNVQAAANMYRMKNGREVILLETLWENGEYLAEEPILDTLDGFIGHDIYNGGPNRKWYSAFSIDPEVCLAINKNLGLNAEGDTIADLPPGRTMDKMSCYGSSGWYTYTARL